MVGGISYNTIKARVAIAKLVVFLGMDAHLDQLASDQSTGRACMGLTAWNCSGTSRSNCKCLDSRMARMEPLSSCQSEEGHVGYHVAPRPRVQRESDFSFVRPHRLEFSRL